MAITHVGSATGGVNPTTSTTVTIPTVQTDDVLILACCNRNSTNAPSVTDNDTGGNTWTKFHDATTGLTLWWKRATSATSGKTITASGFTNSCSVVLSCYRGCRTGAVPYENVSGESNASGNETHAAITPTRNGAWIFLVVANRSNDIASDTQAATSPSVLTERAEHLSGGGSDCSVSIASAEQATAGSTGSITWSQADAASESAVFDLVPALSALAADQGSYSISGQAVALKRGYPMTVAQGSYTITGQAVDLRTFKVTIAQGSYAITGQSQTFVFGRRIFCNTALIGDLVEYWDLDETSGVREGKHAGLDWTDLNTVGSAAGVGGGQTAAEFVRANGEALYRAQPAGLDLPAGDFTWVYWVRPTSSLADRSIGYRYAGLSRDFRSDGLLQVFLAGNPTGAANINTGPGSIALDTWYFVVERYTHANQTLTVRLNAGGVPATGTGSLGSGNVPKQDDGENRHSSFGATIEAANCFDGRIQAIGYWHRALAVEEIEWLYNGGSAARLYADVYRAGARYVIDGQGVGLSKGRILACENGSYAVTGQAQSFSVAHRLICETAVYNLDGQVVNLLRGYPVAVENGTYTLTGNDVGLSRPNRQVTVESGTYSLTGQAVTLTVQRRVALDFGSYAYTGQAVNLRRAYPLLVEFGTYAQTGQDVGLYVGRVVLATMGVYTLAGQNVNLLFGHRLLLDFGTYSYAGQDVTLSEAQALSILIDVGAYALAGQDVGLLTGQVVTAAFGTYTVSGQDVGLLRSRQMVLDSGVYTQTGQPTGLHVGRVVSLVAGTYTLAGQDVSLRVGWKLPVTFGTYALTGTDVGLLFGHRLAVNEGTYALTGVSVNFTIAVGGPFDEDPLVLLGGDRTLTLAGGPLSTVVLPGGDRTLSLAGGLPSGTLRLKGGDPPLRVEGD